MNNEHENLTTPQQPEGSAGGPEPETTTAAAGQEDGTADPATETGEAVTEAASGTVEPAPETAEASAETAEVSAEADEIPTEAAGAAPEPDAARRLEEMDAAAAETAAPVPEAAGQPEPFPQQAYTPSPYAYQKPEGQGYDPAGAVGEEAAKKSNKTLFIAIGAVLVIVALLIAAFAIGFGSGDKSTGGKMMAVPNRSKDPEGYLAAVTHNTRLEVLEGETILDLGRFNGKPVAHDYALKIDLSNMGYYYSMMPKSIGINGTFKVDEKNQKALFDMAVTSSFISFSGNQLYISPDVVAVAVPSIINRYDYVVINPATFADDYEDSMFYSPYTKLPEDYDLKAQIEAMFDSSKVEDPITDDFVENVAKRFETFQGNATFTDEGSFTETINGKSVEVYKMSYTYEADEIEWFYEDFLDAFEAFMDAQLQIADMAGGMSYSGDLDDMMDVLDSITFTSDATVRYTINQNDQVIRVEAEKIGIEVYNEYWREYEEYQIGYVLELLGEDKISDKIRLELSIYSYDYDETISLVFVFDNRDNSDMVARRYTLEVLDDYDLEGTIQADLEWRPGDDGKNMRLTLALFDDYTDMGIRITGHMENNKDEFSITNGTLELYDGSYTEFELEFEYKLYEIAASELDIKLDDANTILFSELRERDFSLF